MFLSNFFVKVLTQCENFGLNYINESGTLGGGATIPAPWNDTLLEKYRLRFSLVCIMGIHLPTLISLKKFFFFLTLTSFLLFVLIAGKGVDLYPTRKCLYLWFGSEKVIVDEHNNLAYLLKALIKFFESNCIKFPV